MKPLIIIAAILSFAVIISAQDFGWQRNDDFLNPYHIYTKGMNTPFAGDFDGDGDIDLIVGCRGGVLQYYENIGTPDSAIWQVDEDYFSSIALDTAFAPQPSLVDLDGDGVDELYLTYGDNYSGGYLWRFDAYRNNGDQQNPDWQEIDFNIDIPNTFYGDHQFIDFDFDGDFDLLLSGDLWSGEARYYFENVGDSANYDFQLNNSIFDSLDFGNFGEFASYHFADVSGDEKLELFITVGLFDWDETQLYYFHNVGSNENPIWEGADLPYYSFCHPRMTFADLDNDSDKDVIVGNHFVPLFFNENIGTPDTLVFKTDFNGEWLGPPEVDECNHITFADYDNDHDFDLVYWYFRSSAWGDYGYFGSATNQGTALSPVMDNTAEFLSGTFFAYSGYHMSSGDLNGDGFPEMATNWPYLNYYPNIDGTGYNIDNHLPTGIEDIGFKYLPELADFNNDGLTDVIYRNDSFEWLAYQNIGTAELPEFVANTDWLEDVDMPIRIFRAANINRDDKIDLIGVNLDGAYVGFINTGEAGQVDFTYAPAIFDNYSDIVSQDFDCVDIDGDGDDDILAIYDDLITTIENQTRVGIDEDEVALPKNLSLLQNYPNPFNSSTNISYTLDKAGEVKLELFDVLGRREATILNERQFAGGHYIIWKPEPGIPSGIYFYKLTTPNRSVVRKMNYLK